MVDVANNAVKKAEGRGQMAEGIYWKRIQPPPIWSHQIEDLEEASNPCSEFVARRQE
jgi:hypothetical protein